MPSSFMVKRNYAHCPLKKRPLALYNEPAEQPEQTQPEDLSVKRPKYDFGHQDTSASALKVVPSSRLFSLPVPSKTTTHSPSVLVKESQPCVPNIHDYKCEPITQLPICEVNYPSYNAPAPIEVKAQYPQEQPQPQRSHILPSYVPCRPSYTNMVVPAKTSLPQPQRHFIQSQQSSIQVHHPVPHVLYNQQVTPVVQKQEYVPRLSTSPPQIPAMKTSEKGNLPTLAEYYLQLFKATSEAEKKPEVCKVGQNPMPWNTSYLPPSPQASPVTPDQFSINPCSPTAANLMSPQNFASYPDSSALISPVSNCSSTPSDDDDDLSTTSSKPSNSQGRRESRYSCDDCGKSYSTYSGLTKHKQFHCSALGARSFDCKHCDKTYTSLGALKMHIRTHTLPCKCHLCGKAFSRPWLLQGHIRTHTGEKPFQCTECERCFADRSNLRAHLQTHADIKKYACESCHKTFSRMSLLTKHMEAACPAGSRPGNSENIKLEQLPESPASSIEDVEH